MSVLSVWRSIYKYAFTNIIYVLLLCTAFTVVNLIFNMFFTSSKIQEYCASFLGKGIVDSESINIALGQMRITASSLIPPALIVILMCVLIFPIINYFFCIKRGYETGVLRALGLSKARIWKRMVIENIILVFIGLAISQDLTFLMYEGFVHSLFPVDILSESLSAGDLNVLSQSLNVDIRALIILSIMAFTIFFITTGLQNIIIIKNEPIKLIRNYK